MAQQRPDYRKIIPGPRGEQLQAECELLWDCEAVLDRKPAAPEWRVRRFMKVVERSLEVIGDFDGATDPLEVASLVIDFCCTDTRIHMGEEPVIDDEYTLLFTRRKEAASSVRSMLGIHDENATIQG
jgi:hypothetical protein